jgi:hypothetical protein
LGRKKAGELRLATKLQSVSDWYKGRNFLPFFIRKHAFPTSSSVADHTVKDLIHLSLDVRPVGVLKANEIIVLGL